MGVINQLRSDDITFYHLVPVGGPSILVEFGIKGPFRYPDSFFLSHILYSTEICALHMPYICVRCLQFRYLKCSQILGGYPLVI